MGSPILRPALVEHFLKEVAWVRTLSSSSYKTNLKSLNHMIKDKKKLFIIQVWWPLGQVCHLRTLQTLSTHSTYLHLQSLPFKGFNISLIAIILFFTNQTPQNISLHRLVDALGISVPQKPRSSSNNSQKNLHSRFTNFYLNWWCLSLSTFGFL